MKGDIYIDGIDIFSAYGANVTDGLESLFLFPAIKEPEQNDWPEEDGIEVDLESIPQNQGDNSFFFCGQSEWFNRQG